MNTETRFDPCPSAFALDDREIHGAGTDDSVGRHVAVCPRCMARMATRGALDRRFRAQLRDPLWRRVQAVPPRRSWWRAALVAPALAVAAVVVLLRVGGPSDVPPRPEVPDAYRAAKGVAGIRIHGRRDGRVFAFDGSTLARPGDEVQLTVAPTQPDQRYVLVGSVDGTGTFSPFYPAALDGHSIALPGGGQPLLPPIVLDSAPGPERIVIVRSSRPLAVGVVAARAREAAPRMERFVVPAEGDGGGPVVVDVQWVVLPKDVPAAQGPALR